MFKLIRNFNRNIIENIKENRKVFILFCVLRFLVVVSLVRAVMTANYDGASICLLALVLLIIPTLMENGFKIKIPPLLEGITYLFIYAAEILGELRHFYVAIPIFDSVLHTLNGFLAAAVGFSLIDLLNRNSRHFSLSPFYLCLTAFCFSMTIGVLWEFFECAADQFLHMDMQKDFIISSINTVSLDPTHSQQVIHVQNITDTVIHTASGQTYTIEGGYLDVGLLDTMKDLFVNFIGALVFCTLAYIGIKYSDQKKKLSVFDLVPTVDKSDDDNNYLFSESDGFTDGLDANSKQT